MSCRRSSPISATKPLGDVEFFTANIRNPNTRRAYLRACNQFLGWCEDRGLALASIRPHNVATYIEELQAAVQAPSVKQQLAAIRMLFNWLVTGQVVPTNPAARGTRPDTRRENRQNTSARSRRLAQAAQINTDHDVARSARPGIDCDPDLLVCAHHRSSQDEGR